MRKILFILIAGFCLSACTELDNIEFLNLKRDNPLDGKNSTNMIDGVNLKYSNYTIVDDNNDDGIINKGEAVKLQVYLKNNGSSTANKVRATITCSSSYISGLSPTTATGYYKFGDIYYGDYIASGQEGYDSDTQLGFTVSISTPAGTVITFNLSITDESNNTWTDSFTITVVGTGASVGFSKYTVNSDNNGDGIVNKGEAVKLQVYLKNNGTSTANKVRATITCSSSYITGLSPTSATGYYKYGYSSYDYIEKGQEGYDSDTQLGFTVSSSTPAGTVVTFNLSITDESNNTWTDSFTITVVGTGASVGFSKYTVYSDNNGDGIVNKGEAVKLQVYLKNNGTSTANKVRATITCSSSYITGLSPTSATGYYKYGYSSYDYIEKGQEGYDSDTQLGFTVSISTPAGTVITFNLSITDESNNTWTDSFTITVVGTGASVGFSKYTVNSDNNGDGIVNKGEAVKLQVYLKNNGTSTANKVRATITCSSSYITGLSPTSATGYYKYGYSSYDYIEKGQEGYDSDTQLGFTVSSSTPAGTVVTFNLSITDESNNTWTDSFTITVVGTGASVGFSKYTVYSDNNGDGIVNKGEAVKLQVYLKNNGTSTANKVRATITCSSSYITGLSPTSATGYYKYGYSSYDYIEKGQEGYDSDTQLGFTVSSSTPAGTVITFNLLITDESNNTWTSSFPITVH